MANIKLSKEEVVAFFGGTQKEVADALGIKQSSVSDWPDVLSEAISDRVRGAAVRNGFVIPKQWLSNKTAA